MRRWRRSRSTTAGTEPGPAVDHRRPHRHRPTPGLRRTPTTTPPSSCSSTPSALPLVPASASVPRVPRTARARCPRRHRHRPDRRLRHRGRPPQVVRDATQVANGTSLFGTVAYTGRSPTPPPSRSPGCVSDHRQIEGRPSWSRTPSTPSSTARPARPVWSTERSAWPTVSPPRTWSSTGGQRRGQDRSRYTAGRPVSGCSTRPTSAASVVTPAWRTGPTASMRPPRSTPAGPSLPSAAPRGRRGGGGPAHRGRLRVSTQVPSDPAYGHSSSRPAATTSPGRPRLARLCPVATEG